LTRKNALPPPFYALAAIDVMTTTANGAVVALGSSTFQGYESEQDEYDHVIDLLGGDINADIPSGMRKGIVNMGLGGDSLYVALAGRFARGVFTQTGVTGVILYDINDSTTQSARRALTTSKPSRRATGSRSRNPTRTVSASSAPRGPPNRSPTPARSSRASVAKSTNGSSIAAFATTPSTGRRC
jgi:hypothetical protein